MVKCVEYTYQCWKLPLCGGSFATGRSGVCQVPVAPHCGRPVAAAARLVIWKPWAVSGVF